MSRSWSDARPYFERAAIVHVATLMPDGAPHSVPVWAGVEDDRISFFMERGSRKDANLQADPRVAFSVVNPDEPLDMAFIRGRATQRIAGDAALPIIDRIAQRYTGKPYDLRTGMVAYLVQPEVTWSNDYS